MLQKRVKLQKIIYFLFQCGTESSNFCGVYIIFTSPDVSVFQVEFYFSDINLATTDQLFRFMSKDPEGYGGYFLTIVYSIGYVELSSIK